MKKNKKVPIRYIPRSLTKKDKQKQITMLKKSQKLYKKQKYYTRKPLSSYKNKTSSHIKNAQKIYGIDKVVPGKELVKATGFKNEELKKIL